VFAPAAETRSAAGRGQALFKAAANGHPSIVEALMGDGAAVGHRNQDGSTALHHAAYYGQLDCCRAPLSSGGGPECKATRARRGARVVAPDALAGWRARPGAGGLRRRCRGPG